MAGSRTVAQARQAPVLVPSLFARSRKNLGQCSQRPPFDGGLSAGAGVMNTKLNTGARYFAFKRRTASAAESAVKGEIESFSKCPHNPIGVDPEGGTRTSNQTVMTRWF